MRISIKSENDAWETLEGILDGTIVIDELDDIAFGDWLKNTVYIPGKRYDSALSAYMMQGWVEAQRALYRSYALVANGTADARTLTDLQREKLELVVSVHSGSSDQEAALADIIKEVLVGAVDKMDPITIAIIVISLALIWAGQSVWRTWISDKKEERIAETNSKAMLEALNTIQVAVAGDAEKRDILNKAIVQQPVLSELKGQADASRQELIKHTSNVDAEINGVSLSSIASDSLTKTSRKTSEEERKDGVYRVLKVDTTVPDGFRVYIESVPDGEKLQADVQEVMSSLNDRALIQAAEWSKVPVQLQVNARVKEGKVIDAVILRAEKHEVADAKDQT
jgi:hypothetical protein